MGDEQRPEAEQRGIGTKLMFGVWLVSSLLFVTALLAYGRRYEPVFEAMEAAPPALTAFLLELADYLRSGAGMIVALVVQGVSLLPFAGNRAPRLQLRLYGLLAVIGLLALASVWLGLVRPIDQLQTLLAGE